jgi:hypothetical protein
MPLVAVACLLLFFFAALGQSWWWRGPGVAPWNNWSAFYWAMFLLALYIVWPTIVKLLH